MSVAARLEVRGKDKATLRRVGALDGDPGGIGAARADRAAGW